jgi:hypothetical protein
MDYCVADNMNTNGIKKKGKARKYALFIIRVEVDNIVLMTIKIYLVKIVCFQV